MVIDIDGVVYMFDYYMVLIQFGWWINGVDFVLSLDLSVQYCLVVVVCINFYLVVIFYNWCDWWYDLGIGYFLVVFQ